MPLLPATSAYRDATLAHTAAALIVRRLKKKNVFAVVRCTAENVGGYSLPICVYSLPVSLACFVRLSRTHRQMLVARVRFVSRLTHVDVKGRRPGESEVIWLNRIDNSAVNYRRQRVFRQSLYPDVFTIQRLHHNAVLLFSDRDHCILSSMVGYIIRWACR
jgi:hypothetical protein